MKKLLCMLLVICLLAGAALAESNVGKLFDAARTLAFDTHNVTLTAEAKFSYDGEWFKTMHASYKQDGVKSYLSYMLDTPKIDGTVYTGGYTVYGNGNTSYSNDTYYGNYYNEHNTVESDTILTADNRILAALAVARELAVFAEDTVTQTEENGRYSFKVGDLNDLVDKAALYLLEDYIQNEYYRDVFGLYDGTSGGSISIYYEDYMSLLNEKYATLYGALAPDTDIYDDPVASGRMNVVRSMLDQMESELIGKYDSGVVYILKDGTAKWYENEAAYMKQNGKLYISYENELETLRVYYAQAYGTELSETEANVLAFTPNEALWGAYVRLLNEMEAYYAAAAHEKDPDAISAVIHADGSISTYRFERTNAQTVTRTILYNFVFAELKELSADVKLDAEGRLTAFEGTLNVEITDTNDSKHTLEVVFDCTAVDYGATRVPDTFEPKDYGLVSWAEYERNYYGQEQGDEPEADDFWENLIKNAPKTIEIMGTEYETMMDTYASDY